MTMMGGNDDADGRCLGTVLPHALWQGLPTLRLYAWYTLVGSAIWWWPGSSNRHDNHNHSHNNSLLKTSGTFILLLAVLLHSDDVYCSTHQAIPFCLFWWILYSGSQHGSISQAVTTGEWSVVTKFDGRGSHGMAAYALVLGCS